MSQSVLQHGSGACPVGRVSAAEIEAAVVDQLRAVFRQPEIIIGASRSAKAEDAAIYEDEVRKALTQFDPLWDELFPAEQARIVALAVERVEIGVGRARSEAPGRWTRSACRRTQDRGVSETVSVRVPFALKKRGGRKLVVTPEGEPVPVRPSRPPLPDNTLVKALARAHRWLKLLEEGHYATVSELAEAERINQAYLGRVLRLTLLAPEIVEAIIEERMQVTLADLLRAARAEWKAQRAKVGTL